MSEESASPPRTVCGVDGQLVEEFLLLIRDNYRKADKAAYFLEERANIANVYGMVNVRDVLSHLVTMLDPKTPEDQRPHQVAHANEHLRRAAIEPYEVAIEDLRKKLLDFYEVYRREVLPAKVHSESLKDAPTRGSIDASLRKAEQLIAQGRSAKGRNFWDSEWEAGVTAFVDAYEELSDLMGMLEFYWAVFRRDQRNVDRGWGLLAWSVVSTAATLILALLYILK